MKHLTFIAAVSCLALAFTSCKKEPGTGDNSYSIPNGVLLSSFYANQLTANTQNFTVNATLGDTITGANGIKVVIAANSLYKNPTVLITGNVNVELIELYDRGMLATMNKGTMGYIEGEGLITYNDTTEMLVSGGMYYLNITQNGAAVLAPTGVGVIMPVDNTGGADPTMEQFDGVTAGDDMNWKPNLTGAVQVITDIDGVSYYLIVDNKWGWSAAARPHFAPGAKTHIEAVMPTGFTPDNCELFISYEGIGVNLGSLDAFAAGAFTETHGLFPVGTPVNFIAIAVIDGELHYAIQPAVLVEDHVQEFAATQFNRTTQSSLRSIINDLP